MHTVDPRRPAPSAQGARAAKERSAGVPPGRGRRPLAAPAWLARARTVGDPTADVLVARLARAVNLDEVDRLLATLATTDVPVPREVPAAVRDFLVAEGVPSWADRARLLRAQRFAERHAVAIAAALFCASLPLAFTGAKGVSVLQATGRLAGDVDRRVNETGRFVFDILMPGGFESGRAVRSTQKVRLLHAAVRYRVLSARRADRSATRGDVPINQEDLLGTLFCFSIVVLDTLARLGVEVTPAEQEDFLHLWRVTGALVGIREEWLPADVASARVVADAIGARQGRASPDGRELARVLVDGIERHLPARGLGVVAPSLIRYFLGDDAARSLGLAEGVRGADVARMLPALTGLVRRARGTAVGTLLPQLGRSALELWMGHKLGARAPLFETPLAAAACPVTRRRRERNGRGER